MSGTAIALIGNPNSGKTTLFNGLTGGRQYVGNWPGVTVEKKEGVLRLGRTASMLAAPFRERPQPAASATVTLAEEEVRVVDLPGIYTLTATAEDQRVARDYLLSGAARLVVNVVDATNLERNLYLTTQLLEMRVPLLVVLTMADQLAGKGMSIDVEHLSAHLGHPVVGVNANDPRDLDRLREAIRTEVAGSGEPRSASPRVVYPNEIEEALAEWAPRLAPAVAGFPADERWAGLRILEGDGWMGERGAALLPPEVVQETIRRVRSLLKEDVDIVIADHRYGFIHGIVRDVLTRRQTRESRTDLIDRVVTHRIFGIPIFFVAMYLVFWVTIQLGGAFIDFFDILLGTLFVDGLGALLVAAGAPGWLTSLVANGVGAGIQTVATFVPVIVMMLFMLSLLEDSGYMARAAFVMDRFMRLIGLPGRAFVPMLVGFGCTIPAILGTRVLDTKRDRFMTIFMAPLMSCGARLPVYALISTALFADRSGLVVFSIYLAGIALSVLTGLLLKATLLRGQSSHFIMELPPYHAPRLRHILIHTWTRLKAFVQRAGIVIVGFVLVLGFANSFGHDGERWGMGHEDRDSSILARAGKAVSPIFAPMGIRPDNWPAAVGLFTGLFAKEAVVGTLNAIYSQEASAANEAAPAFDFGAGLLDALRSVPRNLAGVVRGVLDPLGLGVAAPGERALSEELGLEERTFVLLRRSFSPAAGYAYLLFVLIYFPCVAALATAIREMGVGMGIALAAYLTVLAWCVATVVYQLAEGGSALWGLVAVGVLGVLVAALAAGGALMRRRERAS